MASVLAQQAVSHRGALWGEQSLLLAFRLTLTGSSPPPLAPGAASELGEVQSIPRASAELIRFTEPMK